MGALKSFEKLELRPVENSDLAFLRQVYASTREDELSKTGWSPTEKQAFIEMQFDAQHRYYQDQFPSAKFLLIVLTGEPIGRLYKDYRETEIRIVDIAILPRFRGLGIGHKLLQDILDEARQLGFQVGIHVEKMNPALSLYLRLGFEQVADQGVYLLMTWSPRR